MEKKSKMNIISTNSEGERNTSNYTKWILITKKFEIVGRLEHLDYNTRDKARSWFLSTISMVKTLDRLEDEFYVISHEEYDFLKEFDDLDSILNEEVN